MDFSFLSAEQNRIGKTVQTLPVPRSLNISLGETGPVTSLLKKNSPVFPDTT